MPRSVGKSCLAIAAIVMLGAAARFDGFAPAASGVRVLVLTSSRAAAYTEAAEGARARLLAATATVTTANLETPGGSDEIRAMLAAPVDVVLAIGSAAVEFVAASKAAAPTVATMVLDSEPANSNGRPGAVVTLDLSPAAQLARLRQMYPGRKRIALIRGPALTAAAATEIQAQARRSGYEVQVVECLGPKQLLNAIGGLRGKVDFVWCLPDRTLYPAPAVSALALAAIRDGLALIGFSEGLVRAGALAGFYPDYSDIGAQSAEAAIKLLEDGQSRREGPRKFKTAVNQRVARVLGMEPRLSAGFEWVAVR